MPRRIPIVLGTLALAPVLAVAGASAASVPSAHLAASCKDRGPVPKLLGGYYNQLKVKGVSCATGMAVEDAFQKCRTKHGLKGTCHTTVVKFKCVDHRDPNQVTPVSFVGDVSCKSGAKTVSYIYQQNTG